MARQRGGAAVFLVLATAFGGCAAVLGIEDGEYVPDSFDGGDAQATDSRTSDDSFDANVGDSVGADEVADSTRDSSADVDAAADSSGVEVADTARADTAQTDTAVADTAAGAETGSHVCGNGAVEATEACDLGTNNGTLTCTYGLTTCAVCSPTCTAATPVTSYCGDGKIDATHETCDDGNATASDGCSATCKVESGYVCLSVSLPSTCASTSGDSNVQWGALYFNDGTVDPMSETVPGKTYKFLTASTAPLTSSSTLDVYMLAGLGDLTSATIRFWDGSAETLYPMTWVDVTTTVSFKGASARKYAVWKGTLPARPTGTYHYRIRAIDGTATAYLKNGVPAGSGADCSAAVLTQPICSVDTYATNDWQYTVP